MQPLLEHVFTGYANLDTPILFGVTPQGPRRVVPIKGGHFEGPAASGEILPGGADWQFTRPDGVTELEALYLLKTGDGVVIQVRNRGLRHGSADAMQRLAAGLPVERSEYYFRSAPEFSAPQGKYEWLNKSLFLCNGARQPSSVELWFYRVG